MKYNIISKHRTLLMGFAAIWIYIFHLISPGALSTYEWWQVPVWFIQAAGFCGVDMFLFLSGFGLAYSMEKRPVTTLGDYSKYVRQRLLRIYQVFLPFAVIFGLLDDWSLRNFFIRLAGVEQLFSNVYAFCWYVVCILVFYLLVPGYMAVYRRAGKGKIVLTVLASLVHVGIIWYMKAGIRADLYAILVRVPVFLLGILASEYARNGRRITWKGWTVGTAMLVLGVYLSFQLNSYQMRGIVPAANALVNVFMAPGLILILSALFEMLEKFMFCRYGMNIFAFFGGISFEFYLMQEWYVRRGKLVYPVTRMLRHIPLFLCMTAVAWLLQKLGKFLFKKVK